MRKISKAVIPMLGAAAILFIAAGSAWADDAAGYDVRWHWEYAKVAKETQTPTVLSGEDVTVTERTYVNVRNNEKVYDDYYVKFNDLGEGSQIEGAEDIESSQITYKYGTGKITLPKASDSKSGKFVGWFTEPDGDGVQITEINTDIDIAAAQTDESIRLRDYELYAYYGTYIIDFDANGGVGTMESARVTRDGQITLPESKFKRTGYTFAGWNTAADGSGKLMLTSDIVSKLTESNRIKLYAMWTPIKYTLNVYFNDGTDTANAITLAYDQVFDLGKADRANDVFVGYNTKADGTGYWFAPFAKVSKLATSGTFNLYAMWASANTILPVSQENLAKLGPVALKVNGVDVDFDANTTYYRMEVPVADIAFTAPNAADLAFGTPEFSTAANGDEKVGQAKVALKEGEKVIATYTFEWPDYGTVAKAEDPAVEKAPAAASAPAAVDIPQGRVQEIVEAQNREGLYVPVDPEADAQSVITGTDNTELIIANAGEIYEQVTQQLEAEAAVTNDVIEEVAQQETPEYIAQSLSTRSMTTYDVTEADPDADAKAEKAAKAEAYKLLNVSVERSNSEAIVLEGETETAEVRIEVPSGALPEGATVKISDVAADSVKDTVSSAVNGEIKEMFVVDITFFDADGKKIEPTSDVKVSIAKKGADGVIAGNSQLVHIADNGKAEAVEGKLVKATGKDAKDSMVFESDEFSKYVVLSTTEESSAAVKTTTTAASNAKTKVAIADVVTLVDKATKNTLTDTEKTFLTWYLKDMQSAKTEVTRDELEQAFKDIAANEEMDRVFGNGTDAVKVETLMDLADQLFAGKKVSEITLDYNKELVDNGGVAVTVEPAVEEVVEELLVEEVANEQSTSNKPGMASGSGDSNSILSGLRTRKEDVAAVGASGEGDAYSILESEAAVGDENVNLMEEGEGYTDNASRELASGGMLYFQSAPSFAGEAEPASESEIKSKDGAVGDTTSETAAKNGGNSGNVIKDGVEANIVEPDTATPATNKDKADAGSAKHEDGVANKLINNDLNANGTSTASSGNNAAAGNGNSRETVPLLQTGDIVLYVIGGVAGIAIVAMIIVLVVRRRRSK